MRRLVEQMLSLALTDSADSRQPFVRVDLNRLVSQTLLTFEPVFYEKGLSLTSQTEEGITVTGNESQLRQVLERFLHGLSQRDRQLFLGRYWYACSLKELCLPKLMRKRSVTDYLREHLEVTP